jgi:exopolyphosphatase/guanosine-5'-triphosphate,3'-diphosphate pyrophosphatase
MHFQHLTAVGPLAAIDLGSNSFRLEIGQVQEEGYRRHVYLKETVRLGAGLDTDGMLTEEAIERGLKCLGSFAQTLATAGPLQVRAVATQTLREARNRDAFLVRAEAALGRPIEVISGREEARLIYTGVAFLQPPLHARLVIDIGGRSTEMILGSGLTPRVAESFQVGCVSLSMRYFGDGRYTRSAFRAAQVAAGAELEEGLQPFARRHWREALGSSGTASAVSELLRANNRTDGRITPAGLRWIIERCLEAGHIDKLDLPGLQRERRPVLAGGVAILYTLCAQFGIDEIHPAKGALRQGVIVDLAERQAALHEARGHDLRDSTVRELQQRFHVDTAQAARVAEAAERLFAGAWPQATFGAARGNAGLGLDVDTGNELRWAAGLHEVGLMVSHHDHHRHSAYIVSHVDAPGFSQSQQRRLGELVLGQRGGLRKVEPALARGITAWQVLCLRLAVIECHARGEVDARGLQLRREGNTARLSFTPQWAEAHPRTAYLLREEAEVWNRQGGLMLALVS